MLGPCCGCGLSYIIDAIDKFGHIDSCIGMIYRLKGCRHTNVSRPAWKLSRGQKPRHPPKPKVSLHRNITV